MKAFTIIELLVVMLITSVVIGAGYMALQLAANYYHKFEEQNEYYLELAQFNQQLSQNMEEGLTIFRSYEGIEIEHTEKGRLTYSFLDSMVIFERQSYRDSIPFVVRKLTTTYQGNESTNASLIDKMSFEVWCSPERKIKFLYRKEYAADVKINFD